MTGETTSKPRALVPVPRAGATLTRKRKLVALAVAGTSDVVQMIFSAAFIEGAGSPFELALDAVTAAAILFIVGFHWRLAIALIAELVPGVDLFPTWTAVVLASPSSRASSRGSCSSSRSPAR